MPYSYYECEEGESQYDSVDLSSDKIVEARYVSARMEADRGNRYIEALPYPRTPEEIMSVYSKSLPGYSEEKVQTMSNYDKMLEVSLLRTIRVPLPFHKDFEYSLYSAMLTSYRARYQIKAGAQEITYVSCNQEEHSGSILAGDPSSSTDAACSLTGYSGCGKSSAVSIAVSHYPQCIIHLDDDGGYFPQIPYLVVNCAANSNFNALYGGIGIAIDHALGNALSVYSAEIDKQQSLEKKFRKVADYIEKFAIGVIIFDEIQLIDFEHTKENSFNTLMTLSNLTKVSIIVVGTEEARDKMFTKLQNSRRVGMQINGNAYCSSKEYFDFIVEEVFSYQWFDQKVIPDENIKDVLFDLTKGIVDQLIGIYSCVCYEYIKREEKPEINADFIRKVANKYYPGMQKVLANLGEAEAEKERRTIDSKAETEIQRILDEERQKEESKDILASRADIDTEKNMLRNVIENLKNLGFSEEQIEDAFKKIWKKSSSKKLSEVELTQKVAALLLGHNQDSKSKKSTTRKNKCPDMAPEQVRNFVLDDEEKKNVNTGT